MTATTDAGREEPARVLLVDDEPSNLDLLRHALDGRGYKLLVATSGEDALKVALRARPSLVLLDVVMPGIDGYETCRRLKADPETAGAAVIFLSALTEAREKVRGLEAGAVDFVTKPFQPEEVVARVHTHLTVQRLQAQLESRNTELARELQVAEELLADARRRVEGALLGASPAVRALRETIAQRAASAEPLLLTGPAGAGHEAVARAVHHSRRGADARSSTSTPRSSPPVTSSGLLDRPAGRRHRPLAPRAGRGRHALPRGGPPAAPGAAGAARRATRGGEPDRAAGGTPAPDVRVVASSSAPTSTESGLRHRLLAALEGGTVRVPSLAERAEDVPELAQFFVQQHARRAGAVVERLSDESVRRLCAYRWPGNLRELESVVERAVVAAREPVLEVDKALLDEGLPLGHYRLLEKLGEGGMGEVWRARHQLLARPCAVKLIRPDRLGGRDREAAVERFRLEARSIARLSSPNTVRLYDFGVSESGSLYFVMELLRGLDLFALVKGLRPAAARAGRVRAPAGLPLARRGARGRPPAPRSQAREPLPLPARPRLRRREGARLRPRQVGRRRDDAQITKEGAFTGTPAYLPPERAAGGPGDARSDIYSLGCVAFWMLTGRTVFTGEPMAIDPRPRPDTARAALGRLGPAGAGGTGEVVMACLEKSPSRRPATAVELWQRLGASRSRLRDRGAGLGLVARESPRPRRGGARGDDATARCRSSSSSERRRRAP